jgi:molybdopterin/thiamine biosynthesis adenylyltransferase
MSPRNHCLRLRSDVMIARTAHGLVVRDHEQAVEFKGERLYERSVDLFRLLVDGIGSFDDLEHVLPMARGNAIRRLFQELLTRGFVYETDSVQTSESDLAPYRQIERYVDHTVGHGVRRMQRVRQGKVLVLGSGVLSAATVHALIELGIGRVDIESTQKDKERIRGYIEDAAVRGKTTQCTLLDVIPSELTTRDGYDVVLLGTEDEDYESMVLKFPWSNYVDSDVGFITGGRSEGWGIVGPFVTTKSMSCLACGSQTARSAMTQVRMPPRTAIRMTCVAIAILGNEMAFEAFKTLAGIESRIAPQWFLLDLKTLVGAYVRADSVLACPTDAHQQLPRTAYAARS